MPTDLPTTVIGLIAFIIVCAGLALKYLADQNRKAIVALTEQNNKTTALFMTYIEKKNGNLERTTEKFLETLEERDMKFDDVLIKQSERHQQSMDDLAARLENSLTRR